LTYTTTEIIFMSQHRLFATHTRQSTSTFSISQLWESTNESSFNIFIEHMVGVRENPKF